jgi:hypothetical protein
MSTIMHPIATTPTSSESRSTAVPQLTLTDYYLSNDKTPARVGVIPHIILFQADVLRDCVTGNVVSTMVMVLEVQTPSAPMLVSRFSAAATSLGGGGNGNVTHIDYTVEFNKWNSVNCTRAYWNRLVTVGYRRLSDEEAAAIDQLPKVRRVVVPTNPRFGSTSHHTQP